MLAIAVKRRAIIHDLSPKLPLLRVTTCVKTRNYGSRAFIMDIEKSIGKSVKHTTPDLFVNYRMHFGMVQDRLNPGFHFLKKLHTEPGFLMLVVPVCLVKLGLCFRFDNEGYFARFLLVNLIFTAVHVEPSCGEHCNTCKRRSSSAHCASVIGSLFGSSAIVSQISSTNLMRSATVSSSMLVTMLCSFCTSHAHWAAFDTVVSISAHRTEF